MATSVRFIILNAVRPMSRGSANLALIVQNYPMHNIIIVMPKRRAWPHCDCRKLPAGVERLTRARVLTAVVGFLTPIRCSTPLALWSGYVWRRSNAPKVWYVLLKVHF
ncbi:hypothetical protein D3C76_1343330 [compost metagenome]